MCKDVGEEFKKYDTDPRVWIKQVRSCLAFHCYVLYFQKSSLNSSLVQLIITQLNSHTAEPPHHPFHISMAAVLIFSSCPDVLQHSSRNAITKAPFTVDVGYERFLGPEVFFHPEVCWTCSFRSSRTHTPPLLRPPTLSQIDLLRCL